MIDKLLEQLGLKKEDLENVKPVLEEKEETIDQKDTQEKERSVQNIQSEQKEDNDLSKIVEYEVLNGRQLFLAKYGHIENIDKMFPIIETQAYRDFTNDLARGQVKGNYFSYLEDAKNKVYKMFEEAYKSFRIFNNYYAQNQVQQKNEQQKPFTVEDLYGEYVKNLKNMTVKHNRLMHVGWKPRGTSAFERGALELNQKSEYKI
jgi:hypothetical protein